jgi:hypothetical protein
MIALVTASAFQGEPLPDPSFSGLFQDALLRRGVGVNVELQTPEFLARNLDSLLSGHGKSLKKVKAKSGSKWDYVMVLRLTGKPVPNEVTDTVAYALTADSRLYTRQGNLVVMRSFSETGAGFSELQARESAASRLGLAVSRQSETASLGGTEPRSRSSFSAICFAVFLAIRLSGASGRPKFPYSG